MDRETLALARQKRAEAIAAAGGLEAALVSGALPKTIETTLAELIVLGLLRQDVRRYVAIFGHGSTELAEVLRIYQAAGLLKTYGVRNEVEAAHAAMALRWITGEKAAVVTSIGPGAMQAFAASLAAASNGVGLYFLFGDETTHDEGPNMQQVPKHEQGLFQRLFGVLGEAYSLHTPEAIGPALQRGLCAVSDPYFARPFYLLMPLNTQPAALTFNLEELPTGRVPRLGPAVDDAAYEKAAAAIHRAQRVVVKVGGGARGAGVELAELVELAGAVLVHTPVAVGALPYDHPRNMHVGGSKGTICGNHAMDEADLVIAVATRAVCQSDSSRTGYPKAQTVVAINNDPNHALHYNKTIPLVGDAAATLAKLNDALRAVGDAPAGDSPWLADCAAKRYVWEAFKQERYDNPVLADDTWGRAVLTQPAAIKLASDFARAKGAVCLFDAGDVQANGFQIVEDTRPGQTFTDTGASYMGWAVSAVLATAFSDAMPYAVAFTGDGSFMMNPQVLIDAVEHGARGCILLFDNRCMAAIAALQREQYGHVFGTSDSVAVDYVALAGAVSGVHAIHGGYSPGELEASLTEAFAYPGLSLVYVPVYYGGDPLGGLGAFGRWNVGNWAPDVQALRHKIGL
jgi:3D-(3,5/4)-trihydroxycyclohexane-1,2-dione acylhydrolase (decyclizing)